MGNHNGRFSGLTQFPLLFDLTHLRIFPFTHLLIFINQINQMSDPNTLGITGFSGTVTDTLFADSNPKEKLCHLVNNAPPNLPRNSFFS